MKFIQLQPVTGVRTGTSFMRTLEVGSPILVKDFKVLLLVVVIVKVPAVILGAPTIRRHAFAATLVALLAANWALLDPGSFPLHAFRVSKDLIVDTKIVLIVLRLGLGSDHLPRAKIHRANNRDTGGEF